MEVIENKRYLFAECFLRLRKDRPLEEIMVGWNILRSYWRAVYDNTCDICHGFRLHFFALFVTWGPAGPRYRLIRVYIGLWRALAISNNF